MSSQYNLEPHPTAKVLLQTTAGDVLIELFAKQTPLTSRNFLQLCLDGYYDNTIFHRLVPGFIIQGGDPTGTGSGGESSYDGEPFADEFHSRLRYNRRGILGMANTGTKDDNGSQFFFTLGNTPELTEKNTMFGRVVGDTIYNLVKMGEAELIEGTDKPMYPTKITGTEILVNPFEDMVKRERVARRTTEEKKEKKKPKRKAGKAILSFGDDEEGEGDVAPVLKKPKFNPDLVDSRDDAPKENTIPSKPKPHLEPKNTTAKEAGAGDAKEPPLKASNGAGLTAKAERKTALSERHRRQLSESRSPAPESKRKAAPSAPRDSHSESSSSSPEPEEPRNSRLDRTNAQIAELKASMRRNVPVAAPPQKKKSALESMIPSTATRGRKRRPGGATGTSAEEQQALDFLSAFKRKLEKAPASEPAPAVIASERQSEDATVDGKVPELPSTADEEAALCDLHFIANCQSCTAWDKQEQTGQADDDNDAGWLSQAISFERGKMKKN
jgi:peptidyl-prolyl cis-trans isomerase SDCCAG10